MIKAIVVDIGNVLITETGEEARAFIADLYGFDGGDFWKYAKKNLDKSYRGQLSGEDFFKGLIEEYDLDVGASEDLAEAWVKGREKTSRVDEVVAETLKKLKGKYVLGVLSNSTELNERARQRRECYEVFDFKILSFEVGIRKPEKKIYDILVKELKNRDIEPGECVFVDDAKDNLGPAEELGIKTILFEDAEQMIRELRELGVEC